MSEYRRLYVVENQILGFNVRNFLVREGIPKRKKLQVLTLSDIVREKPDLEWLISEHTSPPVDDTRLLQQMLIYFTESNHSGDIVAGHVNSQPGLDAALAMRSLLSHCVFRVPKFGANRYNFDALTAVKSLEEISNVTVIDDRANYISDLSLILDTVLS